MQRHRCAHASLARLFSGIWEWRLGRTDGVNWPVNLARPLMVGGPCLNRCRQRSNERKYRHRQGYDRLKPSEIEALTYDLDRFAIPIKGVH